MQTGFTFSLLVNSQYVTDTQILQQWVSNWFTYWYLYCIFQKNILRGQQRLVNPLENSWFLNTLNIIEAISILFFFFAEIVLQKLNYKLIVQKETKSTEIMHSKNLIFFFFYTIKKVHYFSDKQNIINYDTWISTVFNRISQLLLHH